MKAICLFFILAVFSSPALSETTCTQGQGGDVPGYTALCGGYYALHRGGVDSIQGPLAFSFPNVFHAVWPGAAFGTTDIFTTNLNQFISIPFTPVTGHTISLNENQTYTVHPITISVSLAPGRFNNGVKGNGVICVATNNPALKLSSNANPTAQCKLEPTQQYWINVIPAKFSTIQGKWVSFFTGTSARFGVTIYSVN